MISRISEGHELIDRTTSRSICAEIGERLQQSLRPEPSDLSPRLRYLMGSVAPARPRGSPRRQMSLF